MWSHWPMKERVICIKGIWGVYRTELRNMFLSRLIRCREINLSISLLITYKNGDRNPGLVGIQTSERSGLFYMFFHTSAARNKSQNLTTCTWLHVLVRSCCELISRLCFTRHAFVYYHSTKTQTMEHWFFFYIAWKVTMDRFRWKWFDSWPNTRLCNPVERISVQLKVIQGLFKKKKLGHDFHLTFQPWFLCVPQQVCS